MVRNPKLDQRADLLVKHNIQIIHHRDSDCSDSPFEKWFQEIEKLGAELFREYKARAELEATTKPWRAAIWSAADKIACIAGENLEDGGCREPTWRAHLEHHIFSRLENEVTCPKCTGRFWRSEIEPEIIGANLEELHDQRKERTPCKCPLIDRERGRHGLSRRFSTKADQHMGHHKDIAEDITNPERPDLVVGLRFTDEFANLLQQSDGSRNPYPKLSPFKTTTPRHRSPVLPFLVLESKVEKYREDAIFLQSAFVISSLLRLQQQLKDTNGSDSQWHTGPLVWFLSHRGPLWQLSAAIHYRSKCLIISLWNGKITLIDDALRLLLIIDFIVDWARDIYPQAVTMEMEIATRRRQRSVSFLPDIERLSIRQPSIPPIEHVAPEDPLAGYDISTFMLRCFDTTTLAYRDSAYMHHDLCGIYITSKDVRDVLLAGEAVQAADAYAARILLCLTDGAYCLTTQNLQNIEETWTGQDKFNDAFCEPADRLVVKFAFQSLLLMDDRFQERHGEQLHLLTFMAVTIDALKELKLASGALGENISIEELGTSSASSVDQISRCIASRRHGSIRECLARAIRSETCVPAKPSSQADPSSIDQFLSGLFAQWSLDVSYMTSETADALRLPLLIYNTHRIGRKEPTEGYIHMLHHYSRQGSASVSQTGRNFSTLVPPDATAVVINVEKSPSESSSICFLLDLPYDRSNGDISLRHRFSIATPPLPGIFRTQHEPTTRLIPDYTLLNESFSVLLRSVESITNVGSALVSESLNSTEIWGQLWKNAVRDAPRWSGTFVTNIAGNRVSREIVQDFLGRQITTAIETGVPALAQELKGFCQTILGQETDRNEPSRDEAGPSSEVLDNEHGLGRDTVAKEGDTYGPSEQDTQDQEGSERSRRIDDNDSVANAGQNLSPEDEPSLQDGDTDENKACVGDDDNVGDETSVGDDDSAEDENSDEAEAATEFGTDYHFDTASYRTRQEDSADESDPADDDKEDDDKEADDEEADDEEDDDEGDDDEGDEDEGDDDEGDDDEGDEDEGDEDEGDDDEGDEDEGDDDQDDDEGDDDEEDDDQDDDQGEDEDEDDGHDEEQDTYQDDYTVDYTSSCRYSPPSARLAPPSAPSPSTFTRRPRSSHAQFGYTHHARSTTALPEPSTPARYVAQPEYQPLSYLAQLGRNYRVGAPGPGYEPLSYFAQLGRDYTLRDSPPPMSPTMTTWLEVPGQSRHRRRHRLSDSGVRYR